MTGAERELKPLEETYNFGTGAPNSDDDLRRWLDEDILRPIVAYFHI
jgi:hypothetical protein